LPRKLERETSKSGNEATKLTKLVSPFYRSSVKSYAINNISDSKNENTLKP